MDLRLARGRNGMKPIQATDLHPAAESLSPPSKGGPIFFFYLAMLALVVTIGVIDYLLGYGLSMVGFYVFPVGLVSWRGGKGIGSFFSFLSAVGVYIATSFTPPPHVPAIYPEWKAGESLFFCWSLPGWWQAVSRSRKGASA